MPKLKANGLAIEYDTFGNAGDERMLLIMGLGTQMTGWPSELCQALARAGFYVIRFDNRDVGLSSKMHGQKPPGLLRYLFHYVFKKPLKTPYSLDDMVDDATGVLDALGIDSAHIVGCSMGGMIGQLMAVRFPDRVRSLVSLMSSSGDPELPKPSRHVRKTLRSRPPSLDPLAVIGHHVKIVKLLAGDTYTQTDAEWAEMITASVKRSVYPEGYFRQVAAIVADGSRVERLRKISAPTLVIHGSADPLVPVECGIDTARHIEGARLEIIEGMGHVVMPQLTDILAPMIAGHARQNAARRELSN